ncbi:MAG: patatin, partial [Terriglobales bacterium]
YAINRDSEFRVGYEIAEQKLVPINGDSSLYGSLKGRVGATSVRYTYIGRDDPVVPRKGLDLQIKGQWYDANPGAPAGFPVAESQMTYFKPVSKPGSMFFGADGGTTFTYHQTGFPPFALGGNQNLLAYGTNEFLIDQYYLFKAGYIHRILTLPLIVGDKMYAIGGYEVAKVYGLPSTTSSVPTDGYAGILVNTFIGPILLGGSYGATGHHNVFFRLGRVF